MEFKIINNVNDIALLMQEFCNFHDSCIKEIKYISGSYVDDNKSMQPINNERKVCIIFQSQMSKYKTIEVQFIKTKRFNLEPCNEKYDCSIHGATLTKVDGLYYWSEWDNFNIMDINVKKGTWISSEEICWRIIE